MAYNYANPTDDKALSTAGMEAKNVDFKLIKKDYRKIEPGHMTSLPIS